MNLTVEGEPLKSSFLFFICLSYLPKYVKSVPVEKCMGDVLIINEAYASIL